MSLLHKRGEQVLDEVKYLEAELSDRLSKIAAMRVKFIERALEHGFLEEDLPELIADGMTDGIFPTVANHNIHVSEGYMPLIFVKILPGGRIPPEAVEVSLSKGNNNVVYGANISIKGPVRYHGEVPRALHGYEDQYYLAGHELPSRTTKIMDDKNYEFVTMMDSHIPNTIAL